MKTRCLLFGMVVLATCIIVSCATADTVGQDLVSYVNNGVLPLAEYERKALASYGAVVGKNYTSDQAVYDALKNDVIPNYKRFLEGLKSIQPTDREVARLHGTLVSAAESMYRGFQLKMIGIQQKDDTVIRLGNSKIEEGRNLNDEWRKGLNDLAQKYGAKRAEEKGQKTDDRGQTTEKKE